MVFLTLFLLSAWNCNGPEGGIVDALGISDETFQLFAGTVPGLWTREGGRWRKVEGERFEYESVVSIASLKNFILIGTRADGGGGAYLSLNNGESWKKISEVKNVNVNSVRIFKYQDYIRMGICTVKGLYISDDSGRTFHPVPFFLEKNVVDIGYIEKSDEMYVLTEDSLYVKRGTWVNLNVPISSYDKFTHLLVLEPPGLGAVIYAGTAFGIIYMRIGNGPWEWKVMGGSITEITKDPAPEIQEVYLGVFMKGVAKAKIGSNDWEYENEGLPYLTVSSILAAHGRVYCGLSGSGVFENKEGRWEPINTGLYATIITDIELQGEEVYAGVLGNGIWKSINGKEWEWVPESPLWISDIDLWKDTIYVAAGTRLYIRKKGKWDSLFVAPDDSTAVSVKRCERGLYVGTLKGAYFSQDQINFSKIEDIPSARVYSFSIKGDTVIIGSEQGIYISEDGESFSKKNPDFSIKRAVHVEITEHGRIFAHLSLRPDIPFIGYLFYSDDLGDSWQEIQEAEKLWVFSLSDATTDFLLIGESDIVRVTADTSYAEESWIEVSEGLSGASPIVVKVSHKEHHALFLGTWTGVYSLFPEEEPYVSLRSSSTVFSPDGDEKNDQVSFTVNYTVDYPIEWEFKITKEDSDIKKEKRYQPSEIFLWDGYGDNGVLAEDGNYGVALICKDVFLNEAKDSTGVEIEKNPLVTARDDATYPPNTRKIQLSPQGNTRVVYTTFATPEVFYTQEETGTFSPPHCLSNSKNVSSLYPSISGDETPVILWVEHKGGEDVLLISVEESIDTVAIGDSIYSPQVFSENGDVSVIWIDGGVLKYKKRVSDGWGDEETVDTEVSSAEIQDVFIVYEKNQKIYLYDVEERVPEFISDGGRPSIALYNFLHVVWERNGKIFYRERREEWGPEEEVGEGENPVLGVDLLDNPHVVFENNGEVFYAEKKTGTEWIVSKIGEGSYPTCPDIVFEEGFVCAYTKPEEKRIFIYKVEDTVPLTVEIQCPDTLYIPDTLSILILLNKPVSVINASIVFPEGDEDTLYLTKESDTLYDGIYYIEESREEGEAELDVYAEDFSGRLASEIAYVYLKKPSPMKELIEEVHVNPNPIKGLNEMEVIFNLKEDAKVCFEIYSLRGRVLVKETKDFGKGRKISHRIGIGNLGTDLYVLRITAETQEEKKQVKKRFVVIR